MLLLRRLSRLGPNSLFILACVTGHLGGCTGGLPTPSGSGLPDARGPTSDARLSDAPAVDAGPFRCRDRITSGLDNGHHNPGQDCQSSCHNHGFYLSGTLYAAAGGGQPVVGASLTFVDATGATGDLHTGLNGNFWWSLPVTFPITIIASSCPDEKPMTAAVSDAGCNKAGCHAGSASPGRVHLP